MTTRQKLDRSRETRLWIGQVIVPGATALMGVLCIPEVRGAISAKAQEVKMGIERKIQKMKENKG